MRVAVNRLSIFFSMISIFVTFWFCNLFDVSNLPDYESYQLIYENSVFFGQWEVVFSSFAALLKYFGFDYLSFRTLIAFLGLIFIFNIFLINTNQYKGDVRSIFFSRLLWILFPFIITILYLEFFVIRIRGGFSIILFCYGVYLLSQKRYYKSIVGFVMLACSYGSHFFVATTLSFFIGIPFLWWRLSLLVNDKYIIYVLICIIAGLVLFSSINAIYSDRGNHLNSNLHPFRMICLSLIPIALYILGYREKGYLSNLVKKDFVIIFTKDFITLYIIFGLMLFFFYLFGYTSESGEALVRIFTTASIPALIVIMTNKDLTNTPISTYILFCNSMFFLKTVWL